MNGISRPLAPCAGDKISALPTAGGWGSSGFFRNVRLLRIGIDRLVLACPASASCRCRRQSGRTRSCPEMIVSTWLATVTRTGESGFWNSLATSSGSFPPRPRAERRPGLHPPCRLRWRLCARQWPSESRALMAISSMFLRIGLCGLSSPCASSARLCAFKPGYAFDKLRLGVLYGIGQFGNLRPNGFSGSRAHNLFSPILLFWS